MRAWGVAALALLVAGCAPSLIPPGAERAPPPRHRAPRPRPVETPRPPVARPTPSPTAEAPPLARPGGASTPIQPLAVPPAPASATTAAQSGVVAGPRVADLDIDRDQAAAALAAFQTSCPSLTRRTDASGLTRPSDWLPACTAAQNTSPRDARSFFARYFETAQISDGRAFATGYFEPEIRASLTRRSGYEVPIYAKPNDLVDVDLGLFSDSLKGKRIRGRVDGTSFVPYYERGEIEDGALAGRGLELAWAADPVEFFFLQVQGSGRLRLPDGRELRIGYGGQNGRDYVGIGALMRQRGLLGPGEASMQGIVAWLHAHPREGDAIMRENKSFVFFQTLDGAGPLGALGYPVTGGVSAAADPRYVPLGAPVFLSMDRRDATGLWVAQDTGGAIKGSNRFDTFWGAGDAARTTAGGMSARGTAFVLLPLGSVARLQSGG